LDAFRFISSRNGKAIIVENSKKIGWTRHFIDRSDRQAKIVHLLKDPRSRWASLRRREAADLDRCMADWCQENQEIIDFTSAKGIACKVVVYDLVAANPETEVRELFDFIGATFDDSVLRYWEVDHHGFAANGASSALVHHKKFICPPAHFSTGDDRYYEEKFGTSFVDERWRAELPQEENEEILRHEKVGRILQDLGYLLTQSAIERAIPPTSRGASRTRWGDGLRRWLTRTR
jgi:hypothetical protein